MGKKPFARSVKKSPPEDITCSGTWSPMQQGGLREVSTAWAMPKSAQILVSVDLLLVRVSPKPG